MKNLDETYRKLLNLVQEGDLCVPRVTKIAHTLGLPTATVHSRLKKLQKEGAIKGYQGVLNSKSVGKDLTVFTVLKVVYAERYSGKETMQDFGTKLAKIPEIQEVHTCSGDWNFLIKMKVRDTDDYNKVLTENLLPLGGIEKAESRVVYSTFKETPVVKV